MDKILVTGSTGHLGKAVIETLVRRIPSHHISVMTRHQEKRKEFESKGFQAYLGDYNDKVALEKAMTGVDAVLLISSGDQGDRMQEHKNVVNAARKMGVKGIAYTSRSLRDRATLANQLMADHFETEDYIKSSGLKYTFFGNILYMDAIPQFIGGALALERGIFLPAGDGRVAFALRSEMGEAMANVLMNEPFENKTYNFTGDKNYSFYDLAAALTELSGKKVKYTDVPATTFNNMMQQRNLPQSAIKKIMDFILDIKNDQEAVIHVELEQKLNRKPTSLKEGLKQLFEL